MPSHAGPHDTGTEGLPVVHPRKFGTLWWGCSERTMYSTPRRHQRYPLVATVTLRIHRGGETVTMTGRSRNLSHGGVFVQTAGNLCPGCGVVVEIARSAGAKPLVAPGVVVHAIKGEGVGIRFTEMDAETQRALQELLSPLETSP